MSPKLTTREILHEEGVDSSSLSRDIRSNRSRVQKKLMEEELEGDFLGRYRSESVLEAVKKSNVAAQEFILHIMKHKAFGRLGNAELAEAVFKAIERDHNAAFEFMSDPRQLIAVLGPEKMKTALYSAIFVHAECKEYFLTHYKAKFSRTSWAQEVYLRMSHMDQFDSKMPN